MAIMFKKAVYAFKKSTKIIGLVLAVYYLYSFYDPSFLSELRARNGLLGLWVGHFSYFLLSKNPRDIFKDW